MTTTTALEKSKKEQMKARLRVPFLVLLGIFVIVTVAGMDGIDYMKGVTAMSWPVTPGVVTKSDVAPWGHAPPGVIWIMKDPAWNLVLEYSYTVNGQPFNGDQFRYQRDMGWPGYDAFKVKDSRPVGSAVVVRYDPKDPRNSVVDPAPSIFRVFVHLVMVCLFAAMAYLSTFPPVKPDEG